MSTDHGPKKRVVRGPDSTTRRGPRKRFLSSPNEVKRTFGFILREARAEAGLTQEELADRAGIHNTYVSLLERGRKAPTLVVLLGLSEALDARASRLVSLLEDRLE